MNLTKLIATAALAAALLAALCLIPAGGPQPGSAAGPAALAVPAAWAAPAPAAPAPAVVPVPVEPANTGPSTPPVLLNEIMADPASDWDGDGAYNFRDDEWVEIVNVGSTTVALDGYRLAGADSVWRYAFTGDLGPGEVQVVYGSASYAWEQAEGEPLYGLRLGNSGGGITLWRLDEADTVLVDCYSYLDHEAEDDRSSGRAPDGGETWALFDALNPYDGTDLPAGSGCAPSPGETANCETPVERDTWGGLKLRYARPDAARPGGR